MHYLNLLNLLKGNNFLLIFQEILSYIYIDTYYYP